MLYVSTRLKRKSKFKYWQIGPESPVVVEYKVEEKQLHFTVSDCGTGFDVGKTHYNELGQDLYA